MRILREKRCIIGEGPIWNEKEKLLYFVDGIKKEICTYNPENGEFMTYPQDVCVAAIAFSKDGKILASHSDGAFFLDLASGESRPLYDEHISIRYGNDAKVGPDGAFYMGTQSEFRRNISKEINGKLYRIDYAGNVNILIDNLILPNGMDWSPDKRFFYLVDSGEHTLRKYEFDIKSANLKFTGLNTRIHGADGITVNKKGDILVACWGHRCIAIIDPESMNIKNVIDVPTRAPASCAFFGSDLNSLAITTASFGPDNAKDPNSGFLFVEDMEDGGIPPYLFG